MEEFVLSSLKIRNLFVLSTYRPTNNEHFKQIEDRFAINGICYYLVQLSAQISAVLTEAFDGFPQSLQLYVGM
jgi:hypothetical protein